MNGYWWRNWIRDGAQLVAGPFDTPEEAGRWRRDHPPLIDGQGPTLIHFIDGVLVELEAGELACAYSEFAAIREPVMDYSEEAVRVP